MSFSFLIGNSEHWVCVAAVNDDANQVLLFDSLWGAQALERSIELQIAQIFGRKYAVQNTLSERFVYNSRHLGHWTVDCMQLHMQLRFAMGGTQ